MTFRHANVYVVEVIPAAPDADPYLLGPFGATRASQLADRLEQTAPGRRCTVRALMSNDECLHVGDYAERGPHSLK